MTVVGSNVTAWNITVLADTLQTFVGNPTESFNGPPTNLEFVRGQGVNAIYQLELRFDPSASPSRTWGVNIGGIELNRGPWSAVLADAAVPVPSALLLSAMGLAALGLSRSLRRR